MKGLVPNCTTISRVKKWVPWPRLWPGGLQLLVIGPPRTSVSVWSHVQLSRWDRHCWCLLSKGQECCSISYNLRYGHTQQRSISSTMSQAPRLRNSTVTVNWITALFRQKNTESHQSRFRRSGQLLWLLSVLDDVDVENWCDSSSVLFSRTWQPAPESDFALTCPGHYSKFSFLQGRENSYWSLASGSVQTTATHRRCSNTVVLQEGGYVLCFS